MRVLEGWRRRLWRWVLVFTFVGMPPDGGKLFGNTLRELEVNGYKIKQDADLRWAKLSYADLTGADLRSANLENADLSGARLNRSNLTNANLSNAYGFFNMEGQLWAATFKNTTMPDGSIRNP